MLAREGRFRALVYAPGEAEAASQGEEVVGLSWFSVRNRTLLPSPPDEDDPDLLDGWVLPVLTTVGEDADDAAADRHLPGVRSARRHPVPRQRDRHAAVGRR